MCLCNVYVGITHVPLSALFGLSVILTEPIRKENWTAMCIVVNSGITSLKYGML